MFEDIIKELHTKIKELEQKNSDLERDIIRVQNAAKTIAHGENVRLKHLEENYTYDYKLRLQHESLMERDAIMTETIDRLEQEIQELKRKLNEFYGKLAS